MPARVIDDALVVEFVFSDATRFTLNLAGLPCPRLVADLATGLAGLAHPHGEVDAAGTVQEYRKAMVQLIRFLDGGGFTGGGDELTKALLVEFWLSRSRPVVERSTRRLLRAVDTETGVLRPQVREYLAGPPLLPSRWRDLKPLPPYSPDEWDQLERCCEKITEDAFATHRAAITAGQAGQDPRIGGWSPMSNRLWLLLRRGPIVGAAVADYLGCPLGTLWSLGSPTEAARQLFPTTNVTLAYRLLLGMTSGIVPDGVDDLGLGDVGWAGDTTILLEYVKGRTRRESLNLPAPAVRVLRRWLEHSALLRQFAPESERSNLWLAYHPIGHGPTVMVLRFVSATVRRWVKAQELLGDDGAPLRIQKHRIRTTFEHRRDKSAWTGRTTIDPNHSARVEGDYYLSQLTPAQQDCLEAVIEDAQADLVRKATTPLVVTNDDVDKAAAQMPGEVAGLQLTDTVITELVGGKRDVFTAACADQLAGLHGPAGRPCPARPWVCLLCPLAVFGPRPAPNLLRLKAFFARQFRQMPVSHFMAVFGAYAHRLDADILPRFSPAVLAAAVTEVGDRDDELPLRPEETTS